MACQQFAGKIKIVEMRYVLRKSLGLDFFTAQDLPLVFSYLKRLFLPYFPIIICPKLQIYNMTVLLDQQYNHIYSYTAESLELMLVSYIRIVR